MPSPLLRNRTDLRALTSQPRSVRSWAQDSFAAERLEEGRWNILLRGIERIRLVEEHEQIHKFRTVRSEILEDVDVPMEHPLHSQLRSLVGQLSDNAPEAREGLNLIMSQVQHLPASQTSSGHMPHQTHSFGVNYWKRWMLKNV